MLGIEKAFKVNKEPAPEGLGLKYRPSLVNGRNDEDFAKLAFRHCVGQINCKIEFSTRNRALLLSDLALVPENGCVVEIGVQKPDNGDYSSTFTILNEKREDVTYIGIDIKDRSWRHDASRKFHILQGDSGETSHVFGKMDELGLPTIDLLFIDGLHSVNQILRDWEHVRRLSPKGVVLLHDTNFHPGPFVLFDAIDENVFMKQKFFEFENARDWGMARIEKL